MRLRSWMASRHATARTLLLAALFAMPGCESGAPPPASSPRPADTAVAPALDSVRTLIRQGRYLDAEDRSRRLLTDAAVPGDSSLTTAAVLDLLVEAMRRGGKGSLPETRTLAERAVRIRAARTPDGDPSRLPGLRNLANVLRDSSRYPEARSTFETVLALARSLPKQDPLELAEDWHDYAAALYLVAEYEGAKHAVDRALELRLQNLPRSDARIGTTIALRAPIEAARDEFDAAERDYREGIRILESALGKDDLQVATQVNGYGALLWRRGEYAAAGRQYRRTLAIRQARLPADHLLIAGALNNVGTIAFLLGDVDSARTMWERALGIQEKQLGHGHAVVANTIFNLGSAERSAGNYSRSLARYDSALAIHRRIQGGEKNPQVANDYMVIGDVLDEMGDFSGASHAYESALSIQQEVHGPRHSEVCGPMQALGNLQLETGEYAAAKRQLAAALAIHVQTIGDRDDIAGGMRIDLARAQWATGEQDAARRSFERGLSVLRTALGPRSSSVGSGLGPYVDFLLDRGDVENARLRAEEAHDILGEELGHEHPLTGQALQRLARARRAAGDTVGAFEAALGAEEIGRESLRRMARTLTERRALQFDEIRASGLDLALAIAASASGRLPDASARAWDALVRSRALVLDEMAARNRSIRAGSDPKVRDSAAALTRARQRLANLTLRGGMGDQPEHYRALVDSARGDVDRAERELSERSGTSRHETDWARAGLVEMTRALPQGTAMVAFVRVHEPDRGVGSLAGFSQSRRSSDRGGRYLACMARPGANPVLVPLGDAARIDSLVLRWHEAIVASDRGLSQRAEASYRSAGDALRREVWDPLADRIDASRHVFVVPDGTLNLVDLTTLPIGSDRYLLDDGYVFHYLSAERDLAYGGPAPTRATSLLAIGGPDFDATAPIPSPRVSGSRGRPEPAGGRWEESRTAAVATEAHSFRGARPGCEAFEAYRFPALRGAEAEVREVSELWTRGNRVPGSPTLTTRSRSASRPLLLTGAAADEADFKRLAPRCRVLHVATHGFFLGRDCDPSNDRGLARPAPRPRGLDAEESTSPLLRAGLVLAGANHRAQAGLDEEDGVLTAEEIASLDLSNVELAVLSACDTGVGEIRDGEGVFGLRRAFQIAGTRTLIMSLWPVGDQTTRQWMHFLYENRFCKNQTIDAAVRGANVEMLRAARLSGRGTQPHRWGGFVVVGAPE